jgi:hypothetical protein
VQTAYERKEEKPHLDEALNRTNSKTVKDMAKIRKYEPKRVFLETLIGYIEAAKCRTLDKFIRGEKP